MILKAVDLALQMRLFSSFRRFVLRSPDTGTWDLRVALVRRMRGKLTERLGASRAKTVATALWLAGDDSTVWAPLLNAMRAVEEGHPLGQAKPR